MSYEHPVHQKSMVLDEHRNNLYAAALRQLVTPETVVLDVGAGVGVLGLMAAAMGARKVYLVEPATPLAAARQIAQANNLADKIVCIPRTIEQANLPEKVDLILSVFTGNFLLEEDLLPSLLFARDRYLKQGGAMLPDQACMKVAPVSMPDYYQNQVGTWREPAQGIDYSVMHRFATNSIYYDRFNDMPFEMLGPVETLHHVDFLEATSVDCDASCVLGMSRAGTLHGWLGWFEARLAEQWLSTSPQAPATHWGQAYLPVDPVFEVEPTTSMDFWLKRPAFGEWSWGADIAGRSVKQSTFLSRPFTPAELQQRSLDFRPVSGAQTQAAELVLKAISESLTVRDIAGRLVAQMPELFPDNPSALRFVQRQVERFSDL